MQKMEENLQLSTFSIFHGKSTCPVFLKLTSEQKPPDRRTLEPGRQEGHWFCGFLRLPINFSYLFILLSLPPGKEILATPLLRPL